MRISNIGFFIILQLLGLTLWLLNSHATVVHSQNVEYLPGFDGPLPFSLETGYIGMDKGEVQLFYYFFESENNPKQDPVILWLTGGPLCSAMSAILYEIGPIQLEEVDNIETIPKLFLRQYAWTKTASILFVDFPAGAGFSYAETSRANYSGDFKASHNINQFLRKWLLNHPQFLSNPLYLGGDSYIGFTLPLYFIDMVYDNERGSQPFLNLKGYILGNPATDRFIDSNYQVPFAHGMGLISDEQYESLQRTYKGQYQLVNARNQECRNNIKNFEWGLLGIQITMTLESYCDIDSLRIHGISGSKRRKMIDRVNSLLHLKQLGAYTCRKEGYLVAKHWMNQKSVQKALHVRKETIGNWIRCNYKFNYSYEVPSSVPYHVKISAKGFRSLIYSGDHDMIVPFLGTQAWIRSLNYSIIDDWRKWLVDSQIAGFTRTYANRMTFATVKGAGHTAPEYKPKQCAFMFKRWIRGEAL
ncbi:serine carboxypeptidase-like 17 [Chenopodium quinoa]|uniref:serine carboxypeptidase-like 17 n=1 Tax=Chenopodium quinoa TaxID=63459 RepID=UPI000B79015F|nr:serine carboxypeptidase-like 17 [Chenopodium quinoa]XP_021725253.1 serine carboxypeptidase-like 17 [Chenopodium quinoa]